MESKINLKGSILSCVLICLVVTWTGLGYLKWFYGLFGIFSENEILLIANTADYFLQAVGYLIASVLVKKIHIKLPGFMIICTLLELAFLCGSILVHNGVLKYVFGFGADIMCGMLTCGAIFIMVCTMQKYGIVYGFAAAAAGILSFLVTLPLSGELYIGNGSFAVYAIMVLAIIGVSCFLGKEISYTNDDSSIITKVGNTERLAIAFVFIVVTTMNLGYSFCVEDVTAGQATLEIARAMSAIGLILAGILVTYSRQGGLLLCLSAIITPFLAIAISRYSAPKLALWALNYILIGACGVYAVVLFADLSKEKALWIAGFGMMTRRVGEAVGNGLGTILSVHPFILLGVISTGFAVAIILAARLWQLLYNGHGEEVALEKGIATKSEETLIHEFAERYSVSEREQDVLRCVISGQTNSETASALFISEKHS